MEALQTKGFKGRHIDFLYVDEAQDNLIVDAARALFPNTPERLPHFLHLTSAAISLSKPARLVLRRRHSPDHLCGKCFPF